MLDQDCLPQHNHIRVGERHSRENLDTTASEGAFLKRPGSIKSICSFIQKNPVYKN